MSELTTPREEFGAPFVAWVWTGCAGRAVDGLLLLMREGYTPCFPLRKLICMNKNC